MSDRDSGYVQVTLPHEEVIDAHADGSIVHWDIKKEQSTQMEHFSITTAQGDQIDHQSDNILNEILSLRHQCVRKKIPKNSEKFKKILKFFLTLEKIATKK